MTMKIPDELAEQKAGEIYAYLKDWARDRVQAVRDSQGWNDDSMVRLLLDYIEEHDDSGTAEGLADWLTDKADEENREYASDQSR